MVNGVYSTEEFSKIQMEKKRLYKSMLNDLTYQTNYEKKLDQQTIEVLENKISHLLADNGTLKNESLQFEKEKKDLME